MPAQPPSPPNLLLLSGGSKVAIARIAKNAAHKRGITLHISDTSQQVPTQSIADQFAILPKHTESDWANELLEYCRKSQIGLILPTRHCELQSLAQLKPQLAAIGTKVSLSGEKTLSICIQKIDTYHFLRTLDIPTPKSILKKNYDPANDSLAFPIIAKPERGFSSLNTLEANSTDALKSVPLDWILQEKAHGTEFTVNLYIRADGTPTCAIPHQRIAIESGEVVQARTRRIPDLVALTTKIAKALPDAQGIINIQAFYNEATGETSVIEINPRIGGGYPLCDAAKGSYIEWLCQEHLENRPPPSFDSWTDGLLMMRYREALFSI